MTHKKMAALLLAAFLFLLGGCAPAAPKENSASPSTFSLSSAMGDSFSSASTLTDSQGTCFSLPEAPRVVALYGSYAQAWLLAGGTLCGVTEDAIKERDLGLPTDTAIVGTVKEPNAEAILALQPDLVLLSSDISNQVKLKDTLSAAGLACAFYRTDTFEEYASMMQGFCDFTGRPDLFEENVCRPKEQIEAVKTAAHTSGYRPSVLLLRAFSSGVKAKSTNELAGTILADLGCRNLADETPSMLEDLSLEQVISADPEFIFITTMGDEEAALAYFDSITKENPAWAQLTAVKNGNCVVLPKELFHYKPNARWGEAYQYMGEILYPDLVKSKAGG